MLYLRVLLLLCLAMLFCAACGVAPSKTPSDGEGTTPPVEAQTTEASTTSAPSTEEPPPEEPIVLPEKRVFDEEEVYRHVFENQSVKVEKDELETIKIDFENEEALVGFFQIDMHAGRIEDAEYYFVQGVSTETSGHVSKYVVEFNSFQFAYFYVSHDYHEAYLDVMFKHLTFAECEALPDVKQSLVSYVGSIAFDGTTYLVYSDGYLYIKQTEGETKSYFRSEQKVDTPYLATVIFNARQYDHNQEADEMQRYYNQKKPEGTYETRMGTDGFLYYLDDKGGAYRELEPLWAGVINPSQSGGTYLYGPMLDYFTNIEAEGVLD